MKKIIEKIKSLSYNFKINLLVLFLVIFLVTIISMKIAYSKNEQLKLDLEKTKQELIKNDYFIKLKDEIKENNKNIPEMEEKLNNLNLQIDKTKVKNKCLNSQLMRVLNNEKFESKYCEKKENLENFVSYEELPKKITKEKATSKKVAFSLPTKKLDKKHITSTLKKPESKAKFYKVKHKYWSDWDIRQTRLNILYKKGWYDKDMILTFLAENWNMDLKLKSYIVWKNGYRDIWLCQINIGYHQEIVKHPNFFTFDYQAKKCVELYKGWTRFYGYDVRSRMQKNIIFYN